MIAHKKWPIAATLFALASLVLACVPTDASAPSQPVDPAPVTPTEYIPSTVPITPTYEGCAYVWASQDMPELSRNLNASLQAISPDLTALAYAYGENCVYGDGHSTFSAMETDFRVGVKVRDVHDEAALGNWIYQVMQVIIALPSDQLQGPQPGRVDFDFKQPDPAELFVTVPIDKYRSEADNLKGAALFRLFYTSP